MMHGQRNIKCVCVCVCKKRFPKCPLLARYIQRKKYVISKDVFLEVHPYGTVSLKGLYVQHKKYKEVRI